MDSTNSLFINFLLLFLYANLKTFSKFLFKLILNWTNLIYFIFFFYLNFILINNL